MNSTLDTPLMTFLGYMLPTFMTYLTHEDDKSISLIILSNMPTTSMGSDPVSRIGSKEENTILMSLYI